MAALVIGLLATGCSQAGNDSEPDAGSASGDAFCQVLAEQVEFPANDEGDLIVFLDPTAGTAERTMVEAALQQSALVEDVRYVDRDASYDKFQELVRGNDEMLDNVRPEDLPTSFEVDLEPGWTDAAAVAFIAELRGRNDVFEVRGHGVPTLRVFDALVLAGSAPALAMGIEADLAKGPAADRWLDQVDTVQDEADPEVSDAVELLAATLGDQKLPATEGSPQYRRNADAAETVATAGKARCDLRVPGFLNEPGTGN